MRGVFEMAETVFAFLAVIGIAWWVGTIYMAEKEQKLIQACVPIEFSTNGLHHVTTALVGYPPRWTLSLQSYLMGGCYYFFSVMLPNQSGNISTGGISAQGGIHQ
jgi:hypothetical protein